MPLHPIKLMFQPDSEKCAIITASAIPAPTQLRELLRLRNQACPFLLEDRGAFHGLIAIKILFAVNPCL